MNIKKPMGNPMPIPANPVSNTEAMKKKAAALEAQGFQEGTKEDSPKLTKDIENISKKSAEIMGMAKKATKDIKTILKNPNAFTDCFPDKPMKKPNANGGNKPSITTKPGKPLKKPGADGGKKPELTPMSPEAVKKFEAAIKDIKMAPIVDQ